MILRRRSRCDYGKLQSCHSFRAGIGYRDCKWLDLSGLDVSVDDYFANVSDAMRRADRQKEFLNEIYASQLPSEVQLPQEFHSWRFNVLVPNNGN